MWLATLTKNLNNYKYNTTHILKRVTVLYFGVLHFILLYRHLLIAIHLPIELSDTASDDRTLAAIFAIVFDNYNMKSFINKGGSAPLDPPRLQRALGTPQDVSQCGKSGKKLHVVWMGLKTLSMFQTR